MKIGVPLVIASMCIVACGTDTGNGVVVVKSGLASAGEAGPTYETRDAAGTRFVVESSRAYIRRIDFHNPGDVDCSSVELADNVKCSGGLFRIEGPFAVDLVTRTSTPSIEVQIPAGNYKRIDVRFDVSKPNDGILEAGDPLEDRALIGTGRFDDNGTDRGFDFLLGFNADARFESENGIEIAADETTNALLLLDVATWLSTVPITDCLTAGDLDLDNGRLQLADGRGQCRALENDIVDAVKKSGRLDRGP